MRSCDAHLVVVEQGGELAERDDEVVKHLLQLVVGGHRCTLAVEAKRKGITQSCAKINAGKNYDEHAIMNILQVQQAVGGLSYYVIAENTVILVCGGVESKVYTCISWTFLVPSTVLYTG